MTLTVAIMFAVLVLVAVALAVVIQATRGTSRYNHENGVTRDPAPWADTDEGEE